jgi:chromate transporter
MNTHLELLLSFTRVGSLAWGGGAGQVPLMKAEVVGRHAWMSEAEFIDALAAGYALPGPISTKMAVYVGYQQAGLVGVAASLTGIILPSALLIGLVLVLLSNFKDHPRIVGMLAALRPAVLGLLVWMVLDLLPSSVDSWHTGLIAVASVAALYFLKLHPGWLILVAGAVGALLYAPR